MAASDPLFPQLEAVGRRPTVADRDKKYARACSRYRTRLALIHYAPASGLFLLALARPGTAAALVAFVAVYEAGRPLVRRYTGTRLWSILAAARWWMACLLWARRWARHVIDAGAADRPRGATLLRYRVGGARLYWRTFALSPNRAVVTFDARYDIQQLLTAAGKIAENLNLPTTIRQDPAHPGTAHVTIRRRDPFKDAAPHPSPLANPRRLDLWQPVEFGTYEDGRRVPIDPLAGHVLIAGVTGSGKSVGLNLWVAAAALGGATVSLLENKGSEFRRWRPIAAGYAEDDMADAIRVLESCRDWMQARHRANAANGRTKHGPGDPLHFLVIDEASYYLSHRDKDARQEFTGLLLDLVQRARSSGLRVILGMQRPSAALIDSDVREQFAYRIGFRTNSPETTQMVFGTRDVPAHDIPDDASLAQGRTGHVGVGYMGTDRTNPVPFRADMLDDEAIDAIVAHVLARPALADLDRLLAETSQPAAVAPSPTPPTPTATNVNDTRQAILDLLAATPGGLSRTRLNDVLAERGVRGAGALVPVLRDEGAIVRVGAGRGTRYVLPDTAQP